ncbi:YdbH domain-containing protein [uncultured Phenylobacterium sp.]|uniref:intermembrane phospholipid transport protein YdbH family protein n=1 Tax=uncultured Phenylobacterium sp. TaxID=349273 RepID=UPI0025FED7C1|nr:YdbH domain-containing protein [uncultured Phenylobacterium sp.]
MPDSKPAKTRPLRLILALGGVALVLVASLLWLNRRGLARDALTGWLKSKGVAAQADVQAVGPTTFTARLTLGDPKNPDFTAERAEVRYRMTLGGLEVRAVTLKRPVLRASLRGGRLAAGSLDPLIREFLARPPRPDAAKPRIRIEGGVLQLATDYGPIRLTADAAVDDGRLQSLAAISAPTRLQGDGFDVGLGEGALRATTSRGRITASLAAPLTRSAFAGLSAKQGGLTLKLEAPYPDVGKRWGDGLVVAAANVSAVDAVLGDRRFARARLRTSFVGQSRGWISDLAVTGRATGNIEAGGGALGGAAVGGLRAAVVADNLRWTRAGGDRVAAALRVTALADDVAAGGLRVSKMTATAAGPLSASRTDVSLTLTGSALGRGAWTGLGEPAAADGAQLAALKRAARSFRFATPGWRAELRDGVLVGGLDRPLSLRPDSGGEARLAQAGDGYRLSLAGGALPKVDATIRRVSFGPQPSADLALNASGSFLFAEDSTIDAAGRVRFAQGRTSFVATRCAAITAAKLEFGANDVERVAGRLCPAGGPLLTMTGGDWRITGRAEAAGAAIPFLQAKVTGGSGGVTAAGVDGRVTAQVDITAGRLEDTAPQTRFNPLAASGRASLANYVWTADLAVRQPGGPAVGRAHLVHDGGLGVGFVTLETGDLTFAEGGLQPATLSPMASALGSPVSGVARFEGRADWAGIGAGSSGALAIRDMSFQSPAGRASGLNGEIQFTSLAPLTAEAGQSLTLNSLDSIVPLTGLKGSFALTAERFTLTGGEAQVGGGVVHIESLEAPLVAGAPMRGVLRVEGVQLHDLAEASPFGDKVDLDARVSGRIAFEAQGDRVRIGSGELKAIQPGRISIDRTALTGVTADTAIAATGPAAAAVVDDPNATFTDFAYQAMENLAFDTLDATVASRPDGRLGVLFHIVGKHDPPTKQKIRLSIMDLIQKRFMGRKLPLPSGTGVNLTLDTTLNLDDLLSDYAEFRRLHGSGEVQP